MSLKRKIEAILQNGAIDIKLNSDYH